MVVISLLVVVGMMISDLTNEDFSQYMEMKPKHKMDQTPFMTSLVFIFIGALAISVANIVNFDKQLKPKHEDFNHPLVLRHKNVENDSILFSRINFFVFKYPSGVITIF